MKLTFEDKIEIVRLYKDENISINELAKKYKVYSSTIKLLISKSEQHSIKDLMHPAKRKTYTADFKLMIITEVYKGASKTALAVKYNLPGPGTIVLWMNKYEELGYNGLIPKVKGRPKSNMSPKEEAKTNVVIDSTPLTNSEREEYEKLKKNYEILKKEKEQSDMEIDLLKKLNALVQQRKQQQRKKK